ncbi:DUF1002 domain-containing protein [Aliibacillus thermotolerans]|uniref:DUF1002 domain-containing protein n=1 Tax=Aliibacillus thermotolerans TaxID=1834418 RepID=A0ABW0UA36_9BACI|nr:DUF1002 domain-containing protein [Aliibacillus thermotolerans]MDA3130709.1 DUF1002 domain-containing protein [Aliibacillus thermotolerans]
MNRWKTFIACMTALCMVLHMPSIIFADAIEGESIVTLGEDLSSEQRSQLLEEMSATEQDHIITVSNSEEHEYLGDFMSRADIGTNALSSSKITALSEGEGIHVQTNNITKVTEGMYANTLVTAGVEDADVYVTAPFPVSGTAALTGLIKAYEVQNDIIIPEEQKKIANEEMVKTSELGERIGTEEATELVTRIKEEIGDEPIESEEDIRDLIQRIARELGIELTEEELNGLVSLFNRMKDLNIDWDQVQNQITQIRDNLGDYLNREETQSLIQRVLDFLNELIESIKGWFEGESENA